MTLLGALFSVLLTSLVLPSRAASEDAEVAPDQYRQPHAIELIRARCTFCHGPTLMLGFSRRMLDKGGKDALDAFLLKHHVPDAAARDAIVNFLAAPMEDSGN